MSLSPKELEFMLRGGSGLIELAPPEPFGHESAPLDVNIIENPKDPSKVSIEAVTYSPVKPGFGRYALRGACGWLRTAPGGWKYCGGFPERPNVCREFEMGGQDCMELRIRRKVDERPVNFISSLDRLLDESS